MINLIPPHARKQVKIEYWIRVVSVWVLLSAIALLVVAVLLVPSYTLVRSQLSAYEATYQQAAEWDASYKELEVEVAEANTNAKQLLLGSDSLKFTVVLQEIETLAGASIMVDSVDMEREETGVLETFEVKGIAATRAALVAYRDAIEQHELFASAALPISNLAKDREVPFSITVTIHTEQ